MGNPLYWESSYEVVLRLIETHPDVDVESVGVAQLYEWIIALSDFVDEPELANESILNGILRDWYEEVNP